MQDIKNKKYGNLVVIEKLENKDSKGSILWKLQCEKCKGFTYRNRTDLNRGRHRCEADCRIRTSGESPYRWIFAEYRRGARKRNLNFELDFESFVKIVSLDCSYCNSKPKTFIKKKGMRQGAYYNGIDRVDNSKGYTKENVVTACKFCNFAKSRYPLEEFLEWIESIKGQPKS